MTKEELEHDHIKEIAENYVNKSWGSYLDLDEVDLVMAGIGVGKIIANEQDKRIAELEKDKQYFSDSLDKQIEATLKLQQENESLTSIKNIYIGDLLKAKEIIKGLLSFVDSLGNYSGGIFDKAEQFISKVEE